MPELQRVLTPSAERFQVAFFTFFPLLLWGVVMGVWLLAGNRQPA